MHLISYSEYVDITHKEGTIQSWIDWKVEICGMSEDEAIKASLDPEWGYEN